MFEECATPIPVSRLIGHSGFENDVGSVEADARNDIQEITLLGGCLMWNDATVCGGKIRLNVFVSVWYNLWKSRERESAMMFSVPLVCCEYRDVSLLTRFQTIQQSAPLCDSMFTGSKDTVCIQSSALELYVNNKMYEPCPSCRMVM